MKTRSWLNSGSSQCKAGGMAQGMVFTQVVPSPWERKHAIAREYQDAMQRRLPNVEASYGGLEGYITASAGAPGTRAMTVARPVAPWSAQSRWVG
ncbi:MAG: hypothetical protein IPP87_11365 [Ideonella sp.]|nr:hypothetical protein [Ideonella sp.]